MLTIRVFEEHVNELYTTAKMPGPRPPVQRRGGGRRRRLRGAATATTTSRAPTAATGTAWPRAPRSTGCSRSCSAARPATAGARAARCTSPIRRPATSAPTRSSAAARASRRARRCRRRCAGAAQVAVCFFGEGALGQGLLYEVMNMASLWKLPVVYVCENNLYSEYTHYQRDHRRQRDGARRGLRHPGGTVDGQDVRAVHAASRRGGRSSARGATGPSFLVCETYRLHGHHVGDVDRAYYRSREEEATWRDDRDPIARLATWLREQGLANERRPGRDRDAGARARRGGRGVRARRSLPRRRRGRQACLRLAPPPSRVRAAASAS